MIDFNKIVKKMGNKGGKVIFKNDIFEMIDPEKKPEHTSKINKMIYRLRAEGHIISLKSGVYIVPDEVDKDLNERDLIEKYYIKLLKKYISQEVGSHYYISGKKSLEFHLKNMAIPEKIYIVNRSLNKKIQVGDYEIIFQTLSGKYQGKTYGLYNKFAPYIKTIELEGVRLKISGLELALLEAALIHETDSGVDISPLVTTIKKYGKYLDRQSFYEIGKYKYNMSFNRLKEIAKPINTDISELFLDIIKKNGGCFVGEGLRGI